MKKSFFIFILFLSPLLIQGQNFNGGIRFGICGSQVNGDNLSGFNKAGIVAGAFVNRNLSKLFNMQMEIVYIQKGSRKPTDDANSYYRLRVHYIEVPLILKFQASKKINITAGPSFGTLIFSEENNEFGVYEDALPFEKFEFSGNVGVIYKLDDNWSFDARYNQSITTIRPYPGTSSVFFTKGQYNVVVEFSLLRGF